MCYFFAGQIHKQKLEIDKIKVENYDLMRDVVSLNGKLDRAFHVTDEIIFNDATRVSCVSSE